MSRIAWRATEPDGIAHAFLVRLPHALCGARNQPVRFDYPLRSHCPTCLVIDQEVVQKQKAS